MKELLNEIHNKAQELGQCGLFRGDETLEELIGLMFSPRGIEFMITNNFPDIGAFRRLKEHHPERFGVYIDCGKISLSEARKVFLIGDTTAELKYRETAANLVYLQHGASAQIHAAGYAVVRIESDITSHISTDTSDHGKILI